MTTSTQGAVKASLLIQVADNQARLYPLDGVRYLDGAISFSTKDSDATKVLLNARITREPVDLYFVDLGNKLCRILEAKMYNHDGAVKCLCKGELMTQQQLDEENARATIELNAVGKVKLIELAEKVRACIVEEMGIDYNDLDKYEAIINYGAVKLFEVEQLSANMVGTAINGVLVQIQSHDAVVEQIFEQLKANVEQVPFETCVNLISAQITEQPADVQETMRAALKQAIQKFEKHKQQKEILGG